MACTAQVASCASVRTSFRGNARALRAVAPRAAVRVASSVKAAVRAAGARIAASPLGVATCGASPALGASQNA